MLLQLNPSIPVKTPKGNAECIGWIDYSKEDNLLWVCFMDDTGECWIFPNHEIRAFENFSIGRRFKGEK